jgi:glycosyltransferase involved in cell wall biosynthesis
MYAYLRMSVKKLSVVVPCYNEGETIPYLLSRYATALKGRDDIEVILVNDGSKDNTKEVLENQKSLHTFLSVVHVEPNAGYGHAVTTGLRHATAELIGWTHGDLQTPPEDMMRALTIFENYTGEKPLYVKGKRYGRPIFDVIFTLGMSIFESILFRTALTDINAQPNVFRREFLGKWDNPPKDFSLDLYVYLLAKKNGYHVKRFPVHFGKRFAGVSSWNTSWKNKYKFIKRTVHFSVALKKRQK